jgi:hypothetical protein
MGLADKIFDAMQAGVVMNSKLAALTEKVDRMDDDLRDVDRRLIRVETTIEIYTRGAAASSESKQISED